MAKLSLTEKKKRMKELAEEIANLEKVEAQKIGLWIIKDKHFEDFGSFKKHYAELERVYKFYLEKHTKQSETNQNQK